MIKLINAGNVYSELILNGDKYFKTLEKADKDMKSFESKLKGYGDKMEKAGKAWSMKVSAPIAGVGAVATKLGLDFQSAMSEVGAISGATGEDLAILEKKARDMGATTKFSASDAADGLKYMAMAGWDTNAMLEGLDGVLALAAASGEDLGMVSDIVTDSMTAFGLQANEAGHFADVLAKASSSSNTNVGLMGETFKYVAPLAGSLGYSIEDTALGIGLMANAGIKGSQAGTALRSMLTRLVKPTKESGTAMDTLGITMTNTDGSMKSLADVMQDLRVAFADLDPDQQAFYAAQIAGQEAMSGFLAIVNASDSDFSNLQRNINNSTGAAKEMSDMMQDNLKGRWEEFKSALEEVALQIYDLLLPALESWLKKGQAFIDWFSELDDGTKKTILNVAGFAAALGPALLIGGKFANSIGSIAGLFTKFSGAATVATGATTGLTTPVWALGGAAKASTLLLNPWTLGIVAAGTAAYGLYKHLSKDAIPAVEIFGEEVSESTKEAVGGFLDLEKQATLSLNQLSWSGQEITAEMAENIVGNFDEMKTQVVAKLEEQKAEALTSLEELFSESKDMTEEEKEELLRITKEKYDEQIKKTEEGNARISEILEIAKEENRTITEEEKNEINDIKEGMKENGIRLLSETEAESLAILERLKIESGTITAEMAAETVQNSLEQKEKAIANAEEEYNERLKYAATLKADGSKESEELANKIIEEAKRQKDEAILSAEEMHNKVIEEAQKQADEHVDKIDWTTGEILSKWEVLRDDSIKKAKEMGEGMKAKFEEAAKEAVEWGQNIVNGISEGIESRKAWLNEKTEKLASGISNTFKKVFRIASPSGLMAEYGRYIVEGLNEGIDKNKGSSIDTMENFASIVGSAFSKVRESVNVTVDTIEKKFELWKLQNEELRNSSTYLEMQLDMQRQKQEQLTEQLRVAEKALQDITAKYGEGSIEVQKYTNVVLGLQIEHAKLAKEIDSTTSSIEKQTSAIEKQFEIIKNGSSLLVRSGNSFVAKSSGSSRSKSKDWYTWTGSDGKIKSGDKSDFDRDTGYDVDRKEVERLSDKHDVDMGVARDMAAVNKREGKNIYHGGGWVGKPLFDLEGMLAKIQSLLKYDELAGILQEGEFILNKDTVDRLQGAMASINMITMPKKHTETSGSTSKGKYDKGGDINQRITIISPEPLSPSESARKYKQASQQLAMEWGL